MPGHLWRLRTLLLLLLFTGACAPTPAATEAATGAAKVPSTPLRGGVAEFRLISYEGSHLKGRLLLGATIDTLMIDAVLLEDVNVELKNA